MRKQRELDLLVDIAKLLRKYGSEPFESLAELLSSPEMTQRLSHILTQVTKIANTIPETQKRTRTKRRPSIPKSLLTLEGTEPEKYQLLMKFYDDLTAKTVLPSLTDIKEFAAQCGLPEVRAKSRSKAISPLISSLVKSLNEELIAKIQSISRYQTGDRSLEGWSKIILGRKQK
ncbi:MAG: hypothetical protein OEZ48_08685 [Candidatus Bathyarchaeota archaeon]|nr:hypothetical protein [Candidatus Bathyarchaeota archaeon]